MNKDPKLEIILFLLLYYEVVFVFLWKRFLKIIFIKLSFKLIFKSFLKSRKIDIKNNYVKQQNILIFFQVDGVKLENWSKNRFQGIAILNIPSVYGGTNLWGTTKKQKPKRRERDTPKHVDIKYAVQSKN